MAKIDMLKYCGCIFALLVSVSADVIPSRIIAPEFSTTYTVKGTLYIPYAELVEPFFAWYDLETNSSRIDYYGGMVKTYQLSNNGTDYGISLKIAPVTTEVQLNELNCLQVNGSQDNPILPQRIVPDLKGFKFIEMDVVDGVNCEKWRLMETKGAKINKYTMWVRYKKSPKYPSVRTVIPIKYEMKGFNSLLGSHYDHYYLQYDWFSDDGISRKVFEIDSNLTCTGFPGPGDRHIYTFNPMREFIHNYDKHLKSAFEDFKLNHDIKYENMHEHETRLNNFRQNIRYIHSMNRAGLGFTLGVNHLADKTDLELKALRGKQYSRGPNGGTPFPYDVEKVKDIPDIIDWRLFGAVTPVKDQSVCGSCWSFGTTGTLEGALFLKTGQLVRLSQQALIDCSWGYGNNGCDGGEDFRSYFWMMKHGGIPSEDEYGQYLGQDGYCHINETSMFAPITGFVNVTSGDADALRIAVAKHGPISVAIDASRKTFSFYSNGIYYDPECHNTPDKLDHAVLVVGYGTIQGKPYWLVKNSWSTYWGNDGYILMSQLNNNCGVTTDPTYVTM